MIKFNTENFFAIIILLLVLMLGFYTQSKPEEKCNQNENCIILLSKESNNPNLCENIISKEKQSLCFREIALFTNNETLCEKSSNQSECYSKVLFPLQKVELCKKTQNPLKCEISYAVFFNQNNICENSSNTSLCYYSLALHYQDKTLCKNSDRLEQQCLEKIV